MDKKEIIAKLTKMRQQYILNRSKKREEKKFVEEEASLCYVFEEKETNLLSQATPTVSGKSMRQGQF